MIFNIQPFAFIIFLNSGLLVKSLQYKCGTALAIFSKSKGYGVILLSILMVEKSKSYIFKGFPE